MSDWLDDHHAAMGRFYNLSAEFKRLAMAFRVTGNHDMAMTLDAYAEEIREIKDLVQGAISRMLRDEVAESRRQVGETFKTILDTCFEEKP